MQRRDLLAGQDLDAINVLKRSICLYDSEWLACQDLGDFPNYGSIKLRCSGVPLATVGRHAK